MKIFSSKKRAAAIGAVTAATVLGGTVAFAYWTTGGSGAGSAQTGSATSNLTVAASGPTGLVPGGPAQDLALTVTNPNSYSVSLEGHQVSIDPDSIKCGNTTVSDSWFSLGNAGVTSSTPVAAHDGVNPGSGTISPSGVTLQMNDSADNQDVCQGKSVTFALTVS